MTSVNVTTTKNTVTVNGETRVVTVKTRGPQGPSLPDGDKGDVTVSSNGTAISINSNAITSAKIADGAIVDADINASAAIALSKLATGALPTAITVTSANISDLSIVNADINASAAIAGTKISPDFGSQNITTTGTLGSDSITITGTYPEIFFVDTNNNSDYKVQNSNGSFSIRDHTNSANRFTIAANGQTTISGLISGGNGLDIPGNITVSGTVDGRDVATDGTKLDGIETGATADQTASEIKTAYESNSDTNAFTDADHTKLDGIETAATADQTAAEIKTLLDSNGIVNSNVDASAAIAGSKISPTFTSDLTVEHNGDPTILIHDTSGNNQCKVKYETDSYGWSAGLHGGENRYKYLIQTLLVQMIILNLIQMEMRTLLELY